MTQLHRPRCSNFDPHNIAAAHQHAIEKGEGATPLAGHMFYLYGTREHEHREEFLGAVRASSEADARQLAPPHTTIERIVSK